MVEVAQAATHCLAGAGLAAAAAGRALGLAMLSEGAVKLIKASAHRAALVKRIGIGAFSLLV
jgi:hypothetical protein